MRIEEVVVLGARVVVGAVLGPVGAVVGFFGAIMVAPFAADLDVFINMLLAGAALGAGLGAFASWVRPDEGPGRNAMVALLSFSGAAIGAPAGFHLSYEGEVGGIGVAGGVLIPTVLAAGWGANTLPLLLSAYQELKRQ